MAHRQPAQLNFAMTQQYIFINIEVVNCETEYSNNYRIMNFHQRPTNEDNNLSNRKRKTIPCRHSHPHPRIASASDLFTFPVRWPRPRTHTWHKFHRMAKVFAINSTNFLLPPQNQMNYGHIYTSGSDVCEWKNAVPLRKDDDKHMWEGRKYWRRLTTSSCVYKWHQDLYRHWHQHRAFVYRQRNTPPHTIAVSVLCGYMHTVAMEVVPRMNVQFDVFGFASSYFFFFFVFDRWSMGLLMA